MLMRQLNLCFVSVSGSRPTAERGSFLSRIKENKPGIWALSKQKICFCFGQTHIVFTPAISAQYGICGQLTASSFHGNYNETRTNAGIWKEGFSLHTATADAGCRFCTLQEILELYKLYILLSRLVYTNWFSLEFHFSAHRHTEYVIFLCATFDFFHLLSCFLLLPPLPLWADKQALWTFAHVWATKINSAADQRVASCPPGTTV